MKKTIFSAALGAVLLACSINAKAQTPAKVLRIGVLMSGTPSVSSARIRAFQQGLRDLGYVEGKNLVIEYRYADGKLDPVPHLAAELVSLNVDVLLTDTSNATQAAKNATRTIPIVFTMANDPVGDGQVTSLARPGGNLTGFSILAIDLNGKRLDLLKEAIPKVTRVGFLTRTGTTTGGATFQGSRRRRQRIGLAFTISWGKRRRRSRKRIRSGKTRGCSGRSCAPKHIRCDEPGQYYRPRSKVPATGDLPKH